GDERAERDRPDGVAWPAERHVVRGDRREGLALDVHHVERVRAARVERRDDPADRGRPERATAPAGREGETDPGIAEPLGLRGLSGGLDEDHADRRAEAGDPTAGRE